MSLVGPRPHALGSLAGELLFWQVDETYWLRHQLKPGITGLAQIRGLRGNTVATTDLTDRLQADMEYIQGWNIWRDVTILANTARVVLHPNAY
jgi:lipopolysaccharide/colanic/teichoic acid biosynthesis glycosyltransferase